MTRKRTSVLIFGVFLLLCVSYGVWQSREIIFGTKLRVESPINGITVDYPFIEVRGKAPIGALLTVGGAHILTDNQGRFSSHLLLGIGYNVIDVKAVDRFNRAQEVRLEIMYNPKMSGDAQNVAYKINP